VARYAALTACMDSISLEELVMAVRRQSQGFSRGSSSFRGVTKHPSGARPPRRLRPPAPGPRQPLPGAAASCGSDACCI